MTGARSAFTCARACGSKVRRFAPIFCGILRQAQDRLAEAVPFRNYFGPALSHVQESGPSTNSRQAAGYLVISQDLHVPRRKQEAC